MNHAKPVPHHKTRRRYEIPHQIRFLTFSCYQRLAFFTNDAIKNAFVDEIRRSQKVMRFRLFGWVIMPEHVHMLIEPNLLDVPVSVVLSDLKGQFALRVLRRWRELQAPIISRITDRRGKSRFWLGGGGYDRNIYTFEELREKLDYIHNNPVKRGLVTEAADWRWSSARWYAGIRKDDDLPMDPIEV